jgi:signal transduction histidine kinase
MTERVECTGYFKAIRDIQRAVYSRVSVQEVLNVVVIKSTEILNARGALIRIFNDDTGQFEVRAAWGMGERYLYKGPVTTEKLIPDRHNLQSVIVIKDIWNTPRVEYPREVWNEGIRMILDVPLAIDDQLLGIIRIYLEEQREFSENELDFIVTVAEQCAGIIGRVQQIESHQAQFAHLATQVDKMSSLGRMAAGIAHEINNPLAGILLYSSNMRKKVPADSQLAENLQIIIQETQRCKAIIQGLLEFSRDNEPETDAVDINDVIETSLNIIENEFHLKHVQIVKQLAKNMIKTLADKNQMKQVFINMLLNALQAVEENGRVTVTSRVNHQRRTILVEVLDNGCGISSDNLKKIFDPFFSTKANGTGLGLSVSYGIVKNHGGDILAYSEPQKGSRFVVELKGLARNDDQDRRPHIAACSGR